MSPLCIDLFWGLGGWSEGFLAEGWDVVGFDIERHRYGSERYPGQLVLQDVLTIHGSQFRNADCIVASSPKFS
jgi:site-specific DNA-cytosine methylase